MTDKLPPNLLALFAPRPPLRWVPPCDFPQEQRKTAAIGGVADFLPHLEAYKDADGYQPTESWLQARDRKKLEKKAEIEKLVTEAPKLFNPANDPNIRGDAFKTLMVSRLSYDANEEDLEREFGRVGTIERIRIVRDSHADEKGNKKKKPHRGYAFIVFEREKDMRAALEQLDGISIKGRRIKTDVERGRTVSGWKPRRLGGGLGGRGYTKAMPSRPMAGPGGFGGGFRGGRGGGFRGGDRGGFRGGFDRRGGGFGGQTTVEVETVGEVADTVDATTTEDTAAEEASVEAIDPALGATPCRLVKGTAETETEVEIAAETAAEIETETETADIVTATTAATTRGNDHTKEDQATKANANCAATDDKTLPRLVVGILTDGNKSFHTMANFVLLVSR
ncbi:hypothetical protein SLS63_012556 [Diaporthe eres]|uniref:RRM domain-containing protein n=1 Tax=Diaporthe eres TaxID=83184 RepID=A0ABR1NQX0_DIAER